MHHFSMRNIKMSLNLLRGLIRNTSPTWYHFCQAKSPNWRVLTSTKNAVSQEFSDQHRLLSLMPSTSLKEDSPNETLILASSHREHWNVCFRILTRCIHATLLDVLINITSFLHVSTVEDKVFKMSPNKGVLEKYMDYSQIMVLRKTMNKQSC